MKTFKKILIFKLLVFLNLLCFTQNEFRFDHLGSESGLPDVFRISSIAQDSTGFLWVAGFNSLVRYDGYNMKVYDFKTLDTSLTGVMPGYWISSLLIDRENNLWISLTSGLSMYNRDKDNFTNYHFFSEPGQVLYNQNIKEDKNGLLWVASRYNGLYSFNKVTKAVGTYRHEKGNPNSISTDSLSSCVMDVYGNLWISTGSKGLEKFDIEKKSFSHFHHLENDSNSIGSDSILSLYRDKSGNIWIGFGTDSFDELNPLTGKFKHYNVNFDYGVVPSYLDESGSLWLTAGYGSTKNVVLFDTKKYTFNILKNDPLNPESIPIGSGPFYEDKSGVVWIGSWGKGLCKFVRQKQIFVNYRNDLNAEIVRCLTIDSSSNIWLGTWNGLDKLEITTGKFVNYSYKENGIDDTGKNRVISLMLDREGMLWAGTFGSGLNKFDITKRKFINYENNPKDSNTIGSNTITALYEDSYGDLWVGAGFQGLDRFDRKHNKFEHFKNNPGDSQCIGLDNVKTIFEDKNRTLWFGGESNSNGLSCYNRTKGTFKQFSNQKSIRGIYGICEDSKNRFWLCSAGFGLILFDRNIGEAKTYDKKFGLATDYVNNILADNSDRIWLSTHNGLSCFNPETETFRNFNKEDGLKVTDFILHAAYKSKDGKLYFGGDGGIICFNPESFKTNIEVPNIVLTDFKIFNQSVLPSDNSALKEHINVAEEINLDYKDNSFSFEFAALDLNNPKRNQYAYMMEGFDKDWIKSGNIRTATYTNLDPGHYIFHVKGSNNDGVWNEKGTSIKITITPPWWSTWWFRGCGIILVIGILGYTRQRKLSKIRKEMKLKEEFTKQLINTQEAERKRIAGELHDSLGQNLLVIKNKLLLRMQEKKEDDLFDISNLTSSAIEEVRSISHNLSPYEIERLGLTEAIDSIIDNVKNSTKLNIKHEIDNIDNLLSKENEINFYRIIQECITNIIKHSKAKSAELKVNRSTSIIETIISDDGIGLDMNTVKSRNSGMGLAGIQERVNILKGHLNINSNPGRGTEIRITVNF